MNLQAYEGYFENGNFYPVGQVVNSPVRRLAFVTVLDEPVSAAEPQELTREDYLAMGREVLREIHEESVKNGTDKMTMEEIIAEISDYRREKRTAI